MQPLENFYKDYTGNLGRKSVCSECCRAKDRAKRKGPRNLTTAYGTRIKGARSRWKEQGKRVEQFSAADLIEYNRKHRKIEPDRCFITGRQLQWEDSNDRSTYLNLDHVRGINAPRSRHSKTNIVPMAAVVNQVYKREGSLLDAWKRTPAELQAMCYVGLADGMVDVDKHGNPTVPPLVEWSDSNHEGEPPQMGFCEYLRTFCVEEEAPTKPV